MANEIERPDDPQMIYYASSKDINFTGQVWAGFTRQQWADMSSDKRDGILADLVWELVEMGPVD